MYLTGLMILAVSLASKHFAAAHERFVFNGHVGLGIVEGHIKDDVRVRGRRGHHGNVGMPARSLGSPGEARR